VLLVFCVGGFFAFFHIWFTYTLINNILTLIAQSMKDIDLGDAVILDADTSTLTSSYDDMQSLPLEVVSGSTRLLSFSILSLLTLELLNAIFFPREFFFRS